MEKRRSRSGLRGGAREYVGHALECQGDVLRRVGVGEAQVAFAVVAERRSGEAGDARLVEEEVGQGVCGVASVGDTREGVEGALGGEAVYAGKGVQAGDDQVAAGAELGEHTVYAVLRARKGFDAGDMGGGAGAGVRD